MTAQGGGAVLIENCAIATVDDHAAEYAGGHLLLIGGRITAVGAGPCDPALVPDGVDRIDGTGCLATPGLVNTHHHLYQWLTRGLAADATLFEWLTASYPVWAGIDADDVRTAALGGLAHLALGGCTTTTDHHYVVPADAGDVFAAEISAAATVGLRFHPCRGSMDLGRSSGGLPPDSVVEGIDAILAGTAEVIDRHHDPAPDSMCRIAVAPCSPFSVTGDLLRASADLARERGVRLHTHLAETDDEEAFCRERFGRTPMQYMESVGWTGPDVWFAHTVHLDDPAIAAMASGGMAAAHCPVSNGRLGAGIARVPDMLAAGVTVGLGVDGAASNESGVLWEEMHQALLVARATRGPRAMDVRTALRMATVEGARTLGRQDEIGRLAPGYLADVALWRLDTPAHAGIDDPVAALVLGSRPPMAGVWVHGRRVVADGRVLTVDTGAVARDVVAARRRLLAKAG
ncbi:MULTISPECIES: 8-oxoguanine deaminase [unclassified Dietzia]|uniref:8-oxoguanine deaminase n=2 Tax=Dietzia TaxID=37914 RepID=UPI000D209066|nr:MULTISPECIES: 8-oxoguanine deaminase [unclassified Dietzia]AVZ40209.1 8-oxoguanine deaminase [Dietzia sp. JS16-p6b]QGW25666.1 hydroxydechloroatrazine ethylaminohydrolase [Dietzia sp. DQ12-45-1b]